MNYHTTKRSAFSLMELLAVVAILGILAALIMPRVATSTDNAKTKTCIHNRAEINITVEQYYMNTGIWPASDLSDIATNPSYFPEGLSTCPLTGAHYHIDPTTHRVIGHAGINDHN